jgi:hypothetical protein
MFSVPSAGLSPLLHISELLGTRLHCSGIILFVLWQKRGSFFFFSSTPENLKKKAFLWPFEVEISSRDSSSG